MRHRHMSDLEPSASCDESEILKLTILCPTVGRASVERTIDSARLQLAEDDEFWLISAAPCHQNSRRYGRDVSFVVN